MAETPPTRKMQNFTIPRRDGRVKAQIFESLTGTVSAAAAKALAKLKRSPAAAPPALGSETTSSAATSAATSATTSPPQSAYTSDGYPDHA